MPTQPPVLTTARLILRAHTRDNFLDSHAMWSDPEVIRFIGGKPFTREEVWARLLRYAGHWAMLGYGYWVVREKQSGRFLGEVGLADYHREIEPSLAGTPEIGWALSRRRMATAMRRKPCAPPCVGQTKLARRRNSLYRRAAQ